MHSGFGMWDGEGFLGFLICQLLFLNVSNRWVLLESYPIDATPKLQRLFGFGAQVGLIYVC